MLFWDSRDIIQVVKKYLGEKYVFIIEIFVSENFEIRKFSKNLKIFKFFLEFQYFWFFFRFWKLWNFRFSRFWKFPNFKIFWNENLHDETIFSIQIFFSDLDYVSRVPENHLEHSTMRSEGDTDRVCRSFSRVFVIFTILEAKSSKYGGNLALKKKHAYIASTVLSSTWYVEAVNLSISEQRGAL